MYEWVIVQKYVIFLDSKIAKQLLFKNLNPENEAGRLVPDLFLFFRKSFIWGKIKWFAAYFQYNSIALNLAYNKNNLYKTLNCWSRDILNFVFCQRLVSPQYFEYNFSKKCVCLMLYSINWPNFIVWLPLLLEILGIMCIAIVCFPGGDLINFEINLLYKILIFKYLENEKSF